MYYTTGFFSGEIKELCALVAEIQSSIPLADRREWPPILGLGSSVVVALTYLRRNRVQCELAETYGVSQSTISRAISAVTPLLARALARFVGTPAVSVGRFRGAAQGVGPLLPGQGRLRRRCREDAARPP